MVSQQPDSKRTSGVSSHGFPREFASMDTEIFLGVLTTRPVQFSGKLLVEVLDKDGQAIASFTRENCLPVSTDSTIAAVK